MKKEISLKTLILILIILVIITGVTCAYFYANFLGVRTYSINVSGLTFKYKEKDQGIILENPEFMDMETGKFQEQYFDFEVYAEDEPIPYLIYIKEEKDTTISPVGVVAYLTDQNENIKLSPTVISTLQDYPNDDRSHILYRTTITPDSETNNATHKYRLRVWLVEDINAVTYKEEGNSKSGIVGGNYSFKINIATDLGY